MPTLFQQAVQLEKDSLPSFVFGENMKTGRLDPTTGQIDPNVFNGLPVGMIWLHDLNGRSSVPALMTIQMRFFLVGADDTVKTGKNVEGDLFAIEPLILRQNANTLDQRIRQSQTNNISPFAGIEGGVVYASSTNALSVNVGAYAPLGWTGGDLLIASGDLPASANQYRWIVIYFTGVYGAAPAYVVTTSKVWANKESVPIADAYTAVLPADAIRLAGVTLKNGQTTINYTESRFENLRDYLNREDSGVQSVVAGTNVTVNNTDPLNPIVSATGAGSVGALIVIRDKKAQNTAGGTFTSGAWRTRDLNEELVDTGAHASVATNQITLAAGTYRIRASAPAMEVGRHQTRWQNVTDATTISTGTSEFSSNAAAYAQSRSWIDDRFTIAGTKTFELQHQAAVTKATNGYGVEANLTDEIFSVVELTRE